MRRLMYCLLVCAVILSGCQGATKKTDTPEAPVHDVPPAVYPGPNTANPPAAGKTEQPYPGPQVVVPTVAPGNPYPEPGKSNGQNLDTENFAPASGDEKLARGEVTIVLKDSGVILMESAPVQVKLHLVGSMPTPCYHLRVKPAQPDAQKHIQVEVYAVANPDEICAQMIQEFDVEVQLGSFSSGHYFIYINGELLSEFDA